MPTVPADDLDYLKGWTVQSEASPAPPEAIMPQQFVEAQLPDQDTMDELGLTIPENQKTDDETLLDPADQVRVGNTDYASPLGVTANPEGAHIPGESTEAERIVSAPEAAAGAGGDLESMTKAQLQEEAERRGVEVHSTMTKAEMVEALS